MKNSVANTKWYAGGLHFQCNECGQCCSGPGEGYIWVVRKETELIADYLKMPVGELRRKYMKRLMTRTSIIEHPVTKDCIFLEKIGGQKKCAIYHVRPNQCRTWPFWTSNLKSAKSWNDALETCGGLNRGRLYSFEEIEKIRKSKNWWQNGSAQTD